MPSFSKKLWATLWGFAFLGLAITAQAADPGTEPPVPVRTVAPTVPRDFAAGGAAGLVTVSLLIDDKGNVTETSVVKSTHKELEDPAMDAVRKWRFKPAKKDGNPVAVRVAIPIKFEVS
jgi:periplasmic protein TonB